MYLLYIVLGAVLVVVCYTVYKPLLKLVHSVKERRHKPSDIKQLQKQVSSLRTEIEELKEDIKMFHQVTNETQKTNELLFPQNFDKSKVEGETVFVKDGEEKKYETIDWRSR